MHSRVLATFAALLGLLAAAASRAQDVPLYFIADPTAPVALHLKTGDPALASAKPVADSAKAAAGWMSLQLIQTFTGWAPTNTARKDLTVRPGTAVQQLPTSDSPIIGTAANDPATNVEAVQGAWSQVTYPGPLLLYFLQIKTPPPAPAPAPAPTPAPAPAPVADIPTTVVANPASGDSSNLPRYYVGILKLRTNPLTGGPASAQYLLISPNGQLLALVDLSNVMLPGPAANYLGKNVRIYGVTEPANGSLVALLKAQLLQPN
jgi:hypothetical protein